MGKKIAIHSYGPEGARDAVRAGADSLEHAVDIDDATLAEMAKRKIYYVPTIDHNRYYVDAASDYGFRGGSTERLNAYIARNVETARRAWKAGVKFAMGSDAVYTMFGQNTRELGWFVKIGMTPEQALRTATVDAADLMGMAADIGAVKPGCYADLIAVEGDPLADIEVGDRQNPRRHERWRCCREEVAVSYAHANASRGDGRCKCSLRASSPPPAARLHPRPPLHLPTPSSRIWTR